MSDTRTDSWNFFIWPLMVIVAISIFPYKHFGFTELSPIAERWMVYISVAAATLAHIHFGYGVVSVSPEITIIFKFKSLTLLYIGPRNVRSLQNQVL